MKYGEMAITKQLIGKLDEKQIEVLLEHLRELLGTPLKDLRTVVKGSRADTGISSASLGNLINSPGHMESSLPPIS